MMFVKFFHSQRYPSVPDSAIIVVDVVIVDVVAVVVMAFVMFLYVPWERSLLPLFKWFLSFCAHLKCFSAVRHERGEQPYQPIGFSSVGAQLNMTQESVFENVI